MASYIGHGLAYFGLTAGSVMFVKHAYYDMTIITGESMAPTISPAYHTTGAGDLMLWQKRSPARVQPGDVVLFNTPHKPEGMAVKRVIALGGDTVLLDRRRRPTDAQNGRPSEEGKRWDMMYAQNGGKVMVPQGHVWVEGDNWRQSRDSNTYGPISRSLITGKAVGLVWPWRQAGQTPWKGWKSRTKVIPGKEVIDSDEVSWSPI